MKSHALRGTAPRRMAFVAVLLAPALAACGFGAQTDQIYQAAQGADDRSTSVKILNAAIVAQENGTGTFAGTLVNESGATQTLNGVTADGITAQKSVASIAIEPKVLRNLGEPATDAQGKELTAPGGKGVPQLVLSGDAIVPGRYVRLTFEFSEAGKVTVNVPVVSSDTEVGREYQNVPLPPSTSTPPAKPVEGSVPAEEKAPEGQETPTEEPAE